MKGIKVFFGKIVSKYKQSFCFNSWDLELVAKKQNLHLFFVLAAFVCVSVTVFLMDFIPDSMRFCRFEYYKYYLIQICIGVGNLLFLLFLKNRNLGHYLHLLPAYLMSFSYFSLNVYDLYIGGFYYTAYITFAIHGIVCCLLFDLNPLVWTGMITSMVTIYGLRDQEYLRFTNVVILAIVMISLGWWKRSNRVRTLDATYKLNLEKIKNEELLLNILPEKIIQDLKKTGTTFPEKFESVSVLFTDFAGFTSMSKDFSPEFVISELNDIFSHFDSITESEGCTRIKTIGDSYMAVCGVPQRCMEHARKLVVCAKKFIEYLEERNRTAKVQWQMRIGINSGSVTAGIVGSKKYLYDIFGDTVNTASRMESYGMPMRINISEKTKNLLDQSFEIEERGDIEVKGKGFMKMYFVK